MSDLRNPDFDPDHMLEPEQLIELEQLAESERRSLARVPEDSLDLAFRWIEAEMKVARRRALEVEDFDFIECVRLLERRLLAPGCYLHAARTASKVESVLNARRSFRVIDGGTAS